MKYCNSDKLSTEPTQTNHKKYIEIQLCLISSERKAYLQDVNWKEKKAGIESCLSRLQCQSFSGSVLRASDQSLEDSSPGWISVSFLFIHNYGSIIPLCLYTCRTQSKTSIEVADFKNLGVILIIISTKSALTNSILQYIYPKRNSSSIEVTQSQESIEQMLHSVKHQAITIWQLAIVILSL